VEDHEDYREATRILLATFDVTVDAAPDGEAAWWSIHRRRPDLILSDLQMPRLDGFGLMARLRGDPRFRDIPVVALTSRGASSDLYETVNAGFLGHLVKPVTREAVARLLRRFGLTDQQQDCTCP
jgi:CheY-like chemotaxis protein